MKKSSYICMSFPLLFAELLWFITELLNVGFDLLEVNVFGIRPVREVFHEGIQSRNCETHLCESWLFYLM